MDSDKVINKINEYILEAKNFRNDGMVQKHYKLKIIKIFNLIVKSEIIDDKQKKY